MPIESSAHRHAESRQFVSIPGRDATARVPAPVSSLVGRDREAAAAGTLVRDPDIRLVTMTGSGGVGKTRLALRVAADVAPHFEDGVGFVELTSVREPELVVPSIAQALSVHHVEGRPALPALKDLLRGRELLLVLDNFEQVLAAGPVVSALLEACPHLTLLVTSRAILNLSGERVIVVPPLVLPARDDDRTRDASADASASISALQQPANPDAVRLFVERSQAVQPDFALTAGNTEAVSEICTRLDGLPLAIELAAARSIFFSPKELLARLERRLPLLTAGARDLPDRQRTMRDAIAWSYELLNSTEQAVLCRLSVFVGGGTLEAAEAVCAGPEDTDLDVIATIESLTRHSLVQVASLPGAADMPRLTLLETVREFAEEELIASGEATGTRRRHADHYLAFAQRAEPTFWGDMPGDWRTTIRTERENLRAALEWAIRHDETDIALQLASALFDPYVMVDAQRAPGDDAHGQRADVWRALAMPGGSDVSRRLALTRAAWLADALGEPSKGRALAVEALHLAQAHNDEMAIALTSFVLGRMAIRADDLNEARRWMTIALDGFRSQSAHGREAWTLCSLASVDRREAIAASHDATGLARAAQRLDAALATFRATGHLPGITRALHERAQLAYIQDDFSQALALLHELLGLALDHQQLVHRYLEDIATVAAHVGQPELAARLYGAASEERHHYSVAVLPARRAELERGMALARTALGEAALAKALADGEALSRDQAVADALHFTDFGIPQEAIELTPRERDILPLLAEDKTSRQIGATLYLSHRTVEHHLANIYAKLGVRTRAEVVEAARAAGLLPPQSDRD